MTDQPGSEPEQRLPAPRPEAEPPSVERFTSPSSTHEVELTPERTARIVRASADARFIALLAVIFVSLFIMVYYFYELGTPGGVTESRLSSEEQAQQVTAVTRGYNLYQANCARCHGVNGEGGIGPVLNSQEKLYQHLNPSYLNTMLTVGGRFACGNPDSIMPVWSNQGTPPGPLNYTQIADVIAFLRAPNTLTWVIRDPELFEPEIDPATGKVETYTGWVDPNYKPAAGATPFPDCWADAFASAAPSAGASGSPAASPGASPAASAGASSAPVGAVLAISATNYAYDPTTLETAAGKAFQIHFTNNDTDRHNVAIHEGSPTGKEVFQGEIFLGPGERTYDVPALPAGAYGYVCTVHANMTGTLTVK